MTRLQLALVLAAGWPAVAAAGPTESEREANRELELEVVRARPVRGRYVLRASLGTELDTNALRRIEVEPGTETPTDGVLRLVLDGYGWHKLGRGWSLGAQLLAGAKRFLDLSSEDQWAQFTSLQLMKSWDRLSLGTYGSFRISRMRRGVRDYAQEQAQLRADLRVGDDATVRVWGGVLAYQFEPDPDFSYIGPSVGTYLRKPLVADLMLTGWVEGYLQLYEGNALAVDPGAADPRREFGPCTTSTEDFTCESRRDGQLRVGGQLRWDGTVAAGVSYQVSIQESNSRTTDIENDDGTTERIALEDVTRHRVSAFATVPLVWKLLLSVQAAVQINVGTSITDALLLGDEDENRTSLQVQLKRPLFGPLAIETRYAFYTNQLGGGVDFDFARHTAFLGVSLRTEGTSIDERPTGG